ncbi:hypothetical protein HRbin36_02504 [bacterium HR36]|nr:hypothetical protein HRbin36_02504 [bacterium HR36]
MTNGRQNRQPTRKSSILCRQAYGRENEVVGLAAKVF